MENCMEEAQQTTVMQFSLPFLRSRHCKVKVPRDSILSRPTIGSGVAHPRIVVLIEACEESGSLDLPYYMQKLQPVLGNVALIVCLDSGCGNYEQVMQQFSGTA